MNRNGSRSELKVKDTTQTKGQFSTKNAHMAWAACVNRENLLNADWLRFLPEY